MQSAVLAAMNAQGWQIPDAGVQSDQGLGSSLTPADLAYGHLLLLGPAKNGYFGTPSTMPGALVEPVFITDPFEGSIAASSHGQQVIAAGLAPSNSTSPLGPRRYAVIAGEVGGLGGYAIGRPNLARAARSARILGQPHIRGYSRGTDCAQARTRPWADWPSER